MKKGKAVILTALMLFFYAYTSGAATIVVNPGGSIQAAINSAADGDVIKIAAGTYYESLTISGFNKLTVTGAGQGATIINGTGVFGHLVNIWDSRKIVFQNCTVTGSIAGYDNFFIDNVDNLVITKCTIEYASNHGIYCQYTARVAVKSCVIRYNTFSGVYFFSVYNSSVVSSVFFANSIGVHVDTCHNTLLTGNDVTNNTGYGLYIYYSQNSVVKKNSIAGNGNGIYDYGWGSFGDMYSNNVIGGNTAYGVFVSAGSPTFNSNLIIGNGSGGFYSEDYAFSTLIKNTVSNNIGDGVYLYNSSGYLSKNNITGNSVRGLYLYMIISYLPSRVLTLSGNKITANGFNGVLYNDGGGAGFLNGTKNLIANNNNTGLYFYSGQGVLLDKNTVGINFGNGMQLPAGIATLTKNFVYVNFLDGIQANYLSTISGNRVYYNQNSGITGFNYAYLDRNTVTGNVHHGLDGTGGQHSLIENCKVLGNGDGATYFDLFDPTTNDTWVNNKYDTADL